MPGSTHKCPGPECQDQIPRAQLMCTAHWRQVPKPLQTEVYAAWARGHGAGTARHMAAIRAAIEAVNP